MKKHMSYQIQNMYEAIIFKRVIYRFKNMKVKKWTKRDSSEINPTCIYICITKFNILVPALKYYIFNENRKLSKITSKQ